MTDFAFKVTGDASAAHRANEQVLAQLDRIEAEARQAGSALSTSFASAGAAISKASAEARQSADAQKTMAQRMRGLSDELANQERMWQRIHGPAQRYAADLKALDHLLHQNEISTAQYANEVMRLNRAIDGAPKAAAPRATAAPSSSASDIMGGVRTAATMFGVGVGVSQLTDLADAYTSIQNRLRVMTGDQAQANRLFSELQGIAQRTRSDLTATVDAYAGMSRATKALGLSQAETLSVTETLNKLVTVSGKSASESAAGLMQFSQALSSGRLQGDELRSVFENMPSLVDALMASTGKTQAELRAMGSEGKITSKIMIEALQQAADSADASMGKTIPTIAQSWTMFRNEMMVTVGEMSNSLNVTGALSTLLNGLAGAINIAATAAGVLGDAIGGIQDIGVDLGAGTMLGFIAGGPLGAAIGTMIETVGDSIGMWDQATGIIGDYTEESLRARQATFDLYMQIAMGKTTLAEVTRDQTAHTLQLTLGADAARAFRAATAELAPEIKQTTDAAKAMADAVNGIGDAFGRANYLIGQAGEVLGKSVFMRSLGIGQEQTRAIADARKEYEAMREAQKAGIVTFDQVQQAYERLATVMNGGVLPTQIRLWHALKDPVRAYREELAALIAMQGRLSSDEFRRGLGIVMSHRPDGDIAADIKARVDAREKLEADARRTRAVFDDPNGLAQQAERERAHLEVLQDIQTPLDKYIERVQYLRKLQSEQTITAHESFLAQQKAWKEAFGEDEKKRHEALTKSWMDRMKKIQQANRDFADSFAPIGDAIKDAFMGAEASLKSLDNVLRNVAFNMFKFMALQAATSIGAANGGGLASAILGGIFGGAPGMATGGVVMAGTGGTDSELVAIRKSPNEMMTAFFETPGQLRSRQMGAGGGGSGGDMPALHFHLSNDRRDLVQGFRGAAGRSVAIEIDRELRRMRRD